MEDGTFHCTSVQRFESCNCKTLHIRWIVFFICEVKLVCVEKQGSRLFYFIQFLYNETNKISNM